MQQAFSFDSETIKKIARGALIAGGGAIAVYVLTYISGLDFGASTPIVVAVCSMLLNAVREFVKGE